MQQKRKPGRPKGSKNKKAENNKTVPEQKNRPFYILWNPEGTSAPSVTFDDMESAFLTAESMQRRIGEGSMFVMKAVAVSTVSQHVKSVPIK